MSGERRIEIVPIEAADGAPPSGSYMPAIVANGLVFVSGQGPIAPDGRIVSGTIAEETALTLGNVRALLRAAGSDLDRVVKCSCYLADIGDFDAFDAAYRTAFGGHRPARTTVAAGLDGIKVEIDAIALLG